MSKDFFEYLKQWLLSEHKQDLHTYIPYYETIKQHKEQLQPLIDDFQEWNFDIHEEHDEEEYYTDGKLVIYLWRWIGEEPTEEEQWHGFGKQEYAQYKYEIELLHDPRHWGYCMCKPTDTGYNHNHKCCGNGCDWTAPRFSLVKVIDVGQGSFAGIERDMWELEEQWSEHLKEHEEKKKQDELHRIEEQLKRLEDEKQRLLNN